MQALPRPPEDLWHKNFNAAFLANAGTTGQAETFFDAFGKAAYEHGETASNAGYFAAQISHNQRARHNEKRH